MCIIELREHLGKMIELGLCGNIHDADDADFILANIEYCEETGKCYTVFEEVARND